MIVCYYIFISNINMLLIILYVVLDQVSFLCVWHKPASGGARLLCTPKWGGAASSASYTIVLMPMQGILGRSISYQRTCSWHCRTRRSTSSILVSMRLRVVYCSCRDMEKVVKAYGKVFHFKQVDKGDNLPLGLPNSWWLSLQMASSINNLLKVFPAVISPCTNKIINI